MKAAGIDLQFQLNPSRLIGLRQVTGPSAIPRRRKWPGNAPMHFTERIRVPGQQPARRMGRIALKVELTSSSGVTDVRQL